MSAARKQFLAARRREQAGIPRPKFKLGDLVERDDGSAHGEVSFVGTFDRELYDMGGSGWSYKVLEPNGRRFTWGENSMVLLRRRRSRR